MRPSCVFGYESLRLRASVRNDIGVDRGRQWLVGLYRWHLGKVVDTEVVEWFKSKGPGYQTRINRILRRVMVEGKKRAD